jgi:hypothetical protein
MLKMFVDLEVVPAVDWSGRRRLLSENRKGFAQRRFGLWHVPLSSAAGQLNSLEEDLRRGSRVTCGKRSLTRKSKAVLKHPPSEPYKNLPTNILAIHQTKVLTTSLYLDKVKIVVLSLYQFSELKQNK